MTRERRVYAHTRTLEVISRRRYRVEGDDPSAIDDLLRDFGVAPHSTAIASFGVGGAGMTAVSEDVSAIVEVPDVGSPGHAWRVPGCECGGCDWVDEPGADDKGEYVVVRCGRLAVPWESEAEHAVGARFAIHRRNASARITGGEYAVYRLERVL